MHLRPDFTFETDHLLLQEAREKEDDFVSFDDLLVEFDVPRDGA